MSAHDVNKGKLALAAAGALPPEELQQVEQHARECPACRRELEVWGSYTRGIGQLPQPMLPPGLVARTHARVLREREEAAERRRNALMCGAFAVFSWAFSFAVWSVTQVLTGGVLEVFGTNLVSAGPWFLGSSVMAWITAATAAVTLGRQGQRRLL
jgi:anti-sigma factor RsiW